MTVYALWSAPRARSTAFFRSMVERGDVMALHEPFWNLLAFEDSDINGRLYTHVADLWVLGIDHIGCNIRSADRPVARTGWTL